jgi:hypothetical protein
MSKPTAPPGGPKGEHLDPSARPFRPSLEYLSTVISAWLLPGAGHWLLGHRLRAVIMGVSILGLFWLGEYISVRPADEKGKSQPLAVTRRVHPIFFCCQVGNGFSTLLANMLWGRPVYPDSTAAIDRNLPTHLSVGLLFTSVSGLLNLLLILHVMDPRTWSARDGTRTREAPDQAAGRA